MAHFNIQSGTIDISDSRGYTIVETPSPSIIIPNNGDIPNVGNIGSNYVHPSHVMYLESQIDGLKNQIKEMNETTSSLLTMIKTLQEQVLELQYAPPGGGPEYQKAHSSFSEKI